MCHVRSATTSLWPARNFFVCRRLTVIVPTAAMNFRSALPPAKQVDRRTNARGDPRHDLARQSRNQKREKRNYRGGAEYAERSFYCKLSLCVLSASVVRIRTFAQAIQTFRHSNTRFSPDYAGKKRFAYRRTAGFW